MLHLKLDTRAWKTNKHTKGEEKEEFRYQKNLQKLYSTAGDKQKSWKYLAEAKPATWQQVIVLLLSQGHLLQYVKDKRMWSSETLPESANSTCCTVDLADEY